MIRVTDIGGATLYLNSDLIERMECVPDTLLTLSTGRRHLVRETAAQIVKLIELHKRRSTGVAAQARVASRLRANPRRRP